MALLIRCALAGSKRIVYVNFDHVIAVEPNDAGGSWLKMTDKETIHLSDPPDRVAALVEEAVKNLK